ncbi:hypothetical protein BC831DRAFT_439610 [Entophlyctis helioformis]|nr:hypothetical protein BC831DRAFT_439610 [Entophlyctis helioformis]
MIYTSLNQLLLMIFAVVAASGIVPALILLALLGGGVYYAWMAIRPTVVAQLDAAKIDVPPEIRRLLGMDATVAGRASASSSVLRQIVFDGIPPTSSHVPGISIDTGRHIIVDHDGGIAGDDGMSEDSDDTVDT